eukprot:tig00020830_g14387.t1
MFGLFKKEKTPAGVLFVAALRDQLLAEQKKGLNKATRELDRERDGLAREEAKLISEIKQAAKRGDQGSAKVLAKQLVRLRAQQQKFAVMRSHVSSVGATASVMKANTTLATAMTGATKAMTSMNKQLDATGLRKDMQELGKQNAKMQMKEEMMGDAIDGALGVEDEDEQSDEICAQLLDEIGINLQTAMPSAARQAAQAQGSSASAARAGAGGGGRAGVPADAPAEEYELLQRLGLLNERR